MGLFQRLRTSRSTFARGATFVAEAPSWLRIRLSPQSAASLIAAVFLFSSGCQSRHDGLDGNHRPIALSGSDVQEAFCIKPEHDGAKLVAPGEVELARFTREGNKLKVKGPDDAVLGFVVAIGDRYKLKDAEQIDLFEFQQTPGGDWKLKDNNEELLYRIKHRPYGFEIEDASETSLFKIKKDSGKTSLRNASDETILSTKDGLAALAMVAFGLEAIESLPIRGALATAIAIGLNEEPDK